jgi:hypothetical protein
MSIYLVYISLLFFRQDAGAGASGGPARLVLGMFTIFPAFGQVLPNNHQTINVECIAETAGKCEEVS